MNEQERKQIIDLIKREVVPAIGCTEPMAVALCTAKAAETLGCKPEAINVLLSTNILKNAMGVGIPGTGMIRIVQAADAYARLFDVGLPIRFDIITLTKDAQGVCHVEEHIPDAFYAPLK